MDFKKTAGKGLITVLTALFLITALTGCSMSNRPEKYKSYVESLITVNYLGTSDEYLEMTGANAEDAQELYDSNANRLADNLIAYYGLEISNDETLKPLITELAKNIYSKVRFSVSKAYEKDNVYYVDVTIYPIDFLNQTHDDVSSYVDEFNTRVRNGYYNSYERGEYEHEFAEGLIEILQSAMTEPSYQEPITITVKIIVNDDSYYISDEDALAIDAAIIAAPGSSGTSNETTSDGAASDGTASDETTSETPAE